jgi:hypothetical protein
MNEESQFKRMMNSWKISLSWKDGTLPGIHLLR